MAWFISLPLRDGTTIYVRPEMVKAVYDKIHGTWSGANVVVDGHDFDVNLTASEVLHYCEFDMVEHAVGPV